MRYIHGLILGTRLLGSTEVHEQQQISGSTKRKRIADANDDTIPFSVEIDECVKEIKQILEDLGGDARPCGSIFFDVEEGKVVMFDFANQDFRDPLGLTEIRHAHFPGDANRICTHRVVAKALGKKFNGIVELVPIEEREDRCDKLITLEKVGKGVNVLDGKMLGDWAQRPDWVYRVVAEILRVSQYFLKRGLLLELPDWKIYVDGDRIQLGVGRLMQTSEVDLFSGHRSSLISLAKNINSLIFKLSIEEYGTKFFPVNLQDPFLLFLDSVYRSKEFAFDHWILAFSTREFGDGQVDVTFPIDLPKTKDWWNEFDACKDAGKSHVAEGDCVDVEAKCGLGTEYTLVDSEASILPVKPLSDGKGFSAQVFETSDPLILQKLMLPKREGMCLQAISTACSEKVNLALLEGLEGGSPKLFQVGDSVPPMCSHLSVFMERAPGSLAKGWVEETIWAKKDEDSWERVPNPHGGTVVEILGFIIQELKVLKRLHVMGFTHNDVHAGNAFVENNGEDVMFIDFGFTRPVVDPSGNPIIWNAFKASPFREEIVQLIDEVQKRLIPVFEKSPSFKELIDKLMVLGLFEFPDHDLYIDLLEAARVEFLTS
jgi:hypothetical protein